MIDTPVLDAIAHASGEYSRATATAYVISAVESKDAACAADFDVSAIVTVSHEVAEGWDFRTIEREIFWRIVSSFMRE